MNQKEKSDETTAKAKTADEGRDHPVDKAPPNVIFFSISRLGLLLFQNVMDFLEVPNRKIFWGGSVSGGRTDEG